MPERDDTPAAVPSRAGVPNWLAGAITAFAEWQGTRRSPRDAVARAVSRLLTASERAAAAALVYAAIRGERRLAFVLAPDLDQLDGSGRAAALVLAQAVDRGELEAGAACSVLRAFAATPVPFARPFARIGDCDAAIAAIADPIQRFAVRHSMPDWLATRLQAEFGSEAEAIAMALATAPPRTVRANLLRIANRSTLAAALAALGTSTALARFAADGLIVTDDSALFDTPLYRRGAFEQQDEGSQLVARVTAPPPRGKVLDACAGSGGKALALAAALGNAGKVLAVDVHERRITALQQRARRAGADNLQALVVPGDRWPAAVAAFASTADRILLDVPCSGIGSWRRRPEARWTLAPHDLEGLQRAQRELIDRAALALRPGARVVYATCTLLRGENEAQVEAALGRHPGLEPVRIAEILGTGPAAPIADPTGTYLSLRPDRHGTDGFFAAVLRRRR